MPDTFTLDDLVPVFEEESLESLEELQEKEPIKIEPKEPEASEEPPVEVTPVNVVSDGNPPLPPTEEEQMTKLAKDTYETYVNHGILPEGLEVNNFEELEEQIKVLPDTIAKSIISSVPDLGKSLIDFVFTKGENLSKQDLESFYATYLNDIAAPLELTDETAKQYVAEQFSKQGLPKTAIDASLDALEVDGKLLETAQALQEKNKPQETAAILQQEKQAKDARIAAQQNFIKSVNTSIDNLEWNTSRKNKIKSELKTGAFNQTISEALKSPEAFVQLANLMTYFDKEKKSFAFEDFIKQLESKPASSLKDKIAKEFITSTNSRTTQTTPTQKVKGFLLDDLEVV